MRIPIALWIVQVVTLAWFVWYLRQLWQPIRHADVFLD